MGLSPAPRRGKGEPRPPAGLAARKAAATILAAVLDRGRPLDGLLDPAGGEPAYLGLEPRDRRLVHAVVATALRRHGEIEAALQRLVERPPRRAGAFTRILEVAAAQILFMDVPDHAAVSLALEDLGADRDGRHFKGLANAVLRRLARERPAAAEADAPRLDTPEWLWRRWTAAYGEATARAIAAAHLVEPALDLTVKADAAGWAERLGGIVLPTGSVRVVPSGPVEEMAGFADGAWWVQDAAAALPARLLGDVRGLRVADLCAAPGGKTAALAHAGAAVTAVDVSAERLGRLNENLGRLGLAAAAVAADIGDWAPAAPFDAILLDAPCTATGTIRRHPDIPWLKRKDDIGRLAAIQAAMLARAASWLKPGGTLVYCTCSLEPEEGEERAAEALATLPLAIAPVAAGEVGGLAEILRADGTVRTLPCHLPNAAPRLAGLDGFFIARFRRT